MNTIAMLYVNGQFLIVVTCLIRNAELEVSSSTQMLLTGYVLFVGP